MSKSSRRGGWGAGSGGGPCPRSLVHLSQRREQVAAVVGVAAPERASRTSRPSRRIKIKYSSPATRRTIIRTASRPSPQVIGLHPILEPDRVGSGCAGCGRPEVLGDTLMLAVTSFGGLLGRGQLRRD